MNEEPRTEQEKPSSSLINTSSIPPQTQNNHPQPPTYHEHFLMNVKYYTDEPPEYGKFVGVSRIQNENLNSNTNENTNNQVVDEGFLNFEDTLSQRDNASSNNDNRISNSSRRKENRRQKKMIIRNNLREKFPLKISIFYTILLIFIASTVLVLQAVLVVKRADLYYLYNGVWGGLSCLTIAIFTITLSNDFNHII
jgi:hypothetical protein